MLAVASLAALRCCPPAPNALANGTFVYHSHADEVRPLGPDGPLVLVEPGATWDPSTDGVVMIGNVTVRTTCSAP